MEASVISPAPFGSLRAAVRGLWDDARGYQRLAYLVGAFVVTPIDRLQVLLVLDP